MCACVHAYMQNSQSLPLNCEIFVGPNCNVEYKTEGKEVCLLGKDLPLTNCLAIPLVGKGDS